MPTALRHRNVQRPSRASCLLVAAQRERSGSDSATCCAPLSVRPECKALGNTTIVCVGQLACGGPPRLLRRAMVSSDRRDQHLLCYPSQRRTLVRAIEQPLLGSVHLDG